jgi:hypothetical protein
MDKLFSIASEEMAAEELAHLMPISTYIVIGRKQYRIEELVKGQYAQIIDIVGQSLSEIYSLKDDKASMDDESVFISKMAEIIASKLTPILEIATGLSAEEIDKNMTSKQIAFAARVIWEINGKGTLDEINNMKKSVIDNYKLFSIEEESEKSEKEIERQVVNG